MSINIKNALLAQAQLREMYASRDSGVVRPDRDAVPHPGTSGQPDRVTLSATALQLARMAEIRTGEPLVNTHRVEEIRQAHRAFHK